MILRLLLLTLFVFQISCSNSERGADSIIEAQSFGEQDLSTLIEDLNDLELAINLDQVLQTNPERSKSVIISAIESARTGVLTVAKFGETDPTRLKDAYDVLDISVRQYDGFGILEHEQFRFDEVFNAVKALRGTLAVKLNLLDNYTWAIYKNNFGTVGPDFSTYAERGDGVWVRNDQIGQTKIKTEGLRTQSWLVSRPFDLSSIRNPSFRIFHSLLARSRSSEIPVQEVIKKVFRVFIILDLKEGELAHEVSDDRKIQMEYTPNEMPLGSDFHDDWTPLKSLDQYAGSKISFAFNFDTTAIKFTQYYIWTIFDFEIHGSGQLRKLPTFNKSDVADFNSLSFSYGGEKWKLNKGAMAVKSGIEETDSMLLSSLFTLPKSMEKADLMITESLRGSELQEAEVLISTNYRGGISPLSEDVKWTVLDTRSETYDNREFAYDLKPYLGETVVIGFRYKSKPGKDFSWTVSNMGINAIGVDPVIAPYRVQDPEENFVVARVTMEDFDTLKVVDEGKDLSPQWKTGSDDNGDTVVRITGRVGRDKDPKVGSVRLFLGEFNVSAYNKPKLRIRHGMKYNFDPGPTKVQIRKVCPDPNPITAPCEGAWTDLVFPVGTLDAAFIDDPETSSWIDLPAEFADSYFEVSLFYKAVEVPDEQNDNTPEWTFSYLQIGGLE